VPPRVEQLALRAGRVDGPDRLDDASACCADARAGSGSPDGDHPVDVECVRLDLVSDDIDQLEDQGLGCVEDGLSAALEGIERHGDPAVLDRRLGR
jgi:hypothetical protein